MTQCNLFTVSSLHLFLSFSQGPSASFSSSPQIANFMCRNTGNRGFTGDFLQLEIRKKKIDSLKLEEVAEAKPAATSIYF